MFTCSSTKERKSVKNYPNLKIKCCATCCHCNGCRNQGNITLWYSTTLRSLTNANTTSAIRECGCVDVFDFRHVMFVAASKVTVQSTVKDRSGVNQFRKLPQNLPI